MGYQKRMFQVSGICLRPRKKSGNVSALIQVCDKKKYYDVSLELNNDTKFISYNSTYLIYQYCCCCCYHHIIIIIIIIIIIMSL